MSKKDKGKPWVPRGREVSPDAAQAEQILEETRAKMRPQALPEKCVICDAPRSKATPGSGKDINNKWICANCRSLI
jgi:hypothetical protein